MNSTMKAVVYHGSPNIKLETVNSPRIQKQSDAIIRVTQSTICGSDIHLIHGITGVAPGTQIGHELVGVVEQVGNDVLRFKAGDRVVVPTFIHCGFCYYCTHGSPAQCENGGILGHGPTFGGMGGAQAEYCWVPFADVNLQSIPDSLTDDDVLFVGDILSTAYFGLEKGMVQAGDTVVIIGPGPVGLCVQVLAPIFGAGKVIMIGTRENRMNIAAGLGAITINPKNEDYKEKVLALTDGRGADVVIECVGTPEAVKMSFDCVRRGGNISLMGVFGDSVEFPLKDLCLHNHYIFTGLVNCDHLAELVQLIETGRINTNFLITHRMKLDDVVEAYNIFENKLDNVLKIVLTP